MDPGASDATAVIDQSLEAILKAAKKMRDCLEVTGDPSFPPDAESLISDSSRKLVKMKMQMENLVDAFSKTKSELATSSATGNQSDEEEETESVIPNPDVGAQDVEIPNGKQLMMANMAAKRDPSDAEINSSLFMKEIHQVLHGAPAAASSSQSGQPSSSQRAKRKSRTGDLEVLQTEPTIPIDPFSKKEIEFAVKNKKCGHIYDRTALMAQLSQSQNPRCPNLGCSNREKLTPNSVVEDNETNALINRLKTPGN